eukprot:CAMPEP_0119141640 /NCGR_PEP_ID=MMETSP1310-20130426/31363_1 /TAXON_ID=464262 /ORGANISM="Genus nov. species nov., Strain RCC2339" /LENGTH=53 /DNA_ID=CAMNT_0007133105 /DNA_START=67 /DNA_END=224 /DNA_ORIENTATION=-
MGNTESQPLPSGPMGGSTFLRDGSGGPWGDAGGDAVFVTDEGEMNGYPTWFMR